MRVSGNKGEWSEFYAFVKLLSEGELHSADEKGNRIKGAYFPVLKVLRSERERLDMEYIINPTDGSVEVRWSGDIVRTIPRPTLAQMASEIYSGIVRGGSRSFEIDGVEEAMKRLACSKISASSSDKTDITLQLHDSRTGYNSICGFSIKSEMGSPPTLLNASGATNFMFEVVGLSKSQAEFVNGIDTTNKIIDRINEIYQNGHLRFTRAKNENFSGNLMLIDSYMDVIIAEMLLDSYKNNIVDCPTLVSRIEARNPLGYPRKGVYRYKFKKFLCSIALGMMPAKEWSGRDEANGGYVIVKDSGDVVAYHIYNRDAFETYLLNNTRFDRGSTVKHGFASIYEGNDGKMYMNLNLQIRFV